MWVFFSVFSIFRITLLVIATIHNTKKLPKSLICALIVQIACEYRCPSLLAPCHWGRLAGEMSTIWPQKFGTGDVDLYRIWSTNADWSLVVVIFF